MLLQIAFHQNSLEDNGNNSLYYKCNIIINFIEAWGAQKLAQPADSDPSVPNQNLNQTRTEKQVYFFQSKSAPMRLPADLSPKGLSLQVLIRLQSALREAL